MAPTEIIQCILFIYDSLYTKFPLQNEASNIKQILDLLYSWEGRENIPLIPFFILNYI